MRTPHPIHCLYLFVFILVAFSCKTVQPELENALIFKNVHTIDAKEGLQKNRMVVVKDNRIIQVRPMEDLVFPESATVIDATGKYLIPGLWDAHVHLSYEPGMEASMFHLFLSNGITSIRDTGGQLDLVMPWRDAARAAPTKAPRVMVAGPLLDGVPTVYDGESRPHLGVGAASATQAKTMVEQFDSVGVDFIKAYEMLTPEAFQAVLSAAKANDLVVTGHVPLSMDVISASDAGFRSMEHMRNLELSCAANWKELLEQRRKMLALGADDPGYALRSNIHAAQRTPAIQNQDAAQRSKVLKHLADNGTWQIPTLTIVAARKNQLWAKPEWRENFNYLPDSIGERWTKNALDFSEMPVDSNGLAFADWGLEMISHLKAAKVEVMAGTDCPIFFLTPGFSLHEELALLVEGGLSPLEAIKAATLLPAQYFNLEEELGLISEGYLADLVLLNENPLEDIRQTTAIEVVVRDGALYNRKQLDEMLANLKEGK